MQTFTKRTKPAAKPKRRKRVAVHPGSKALSNLDNASAVWGSSFQLLRSEWEIAGGMSLKTSRRAK